MATETLSEADKMRRVPGIIFADGPVGRRARVAGTGIDVFEVIKEYLATNMDEISLASAFHWLTREQLQAALMYYRSFPAEIDARLEREAALEDELVRSKRTHPGSSQAQADIR